MLYEGDRVHDKKRQRQAGTVKATLEDNDGLQLVRVAWDDGHEAIVSSADLTPPGRDVKPERSGPGGPV